MTCSYVEYMVVSGGCVRVAGYTATLGFCFPFPFVPLGACVRLAVCAGQNT